MIPVVLSTIGAAALLLTWWFVFSSFRERAFRAFGIGLILAALMTLALLSYGWAVREGLLSGWVFTILQWTAAGGAILLAALLFVPSGRNPAALSGTQGMRTGPAEPFDQKDTAFNIAHVGGYGPELGRLRWSLQSQDPFGGLYWNLSMALRGYVDGPVGDPPGGVPPKDVTREIKQRAIYLGADLVGITTVKPDFVYSEAFSYEDSALETGPAVTHPVDLKHRFIIVLAKEMDYGKVQTTLTRHNEENEGEVGKTYFEIAQVACALASYVRRLGFSARAHHLRNEAVFHVPHAVDAGLGEQGRFNYLITAKYGPRVRLASVTTDLELREDRPVDMGVQDFCNNCRLCEIHCPSKAISSEKKVVRGYLKWPQSQEKCFRFWVSGQNTFDCSLCMKVCPWNKPDTFVHRVGFWAASRSAPARRLLYWMALLFYGKRVRWHRVPHGGEHGHAAHGNPNPVR